MNATSAPHRSNFAAPRAGRASNGAAPAPPDRLARLLDGMRERGCEAAVLVGSTHAAHLCGYARYLGGPHAVVVSADGARTLLVPVYEREVAASLADAEHVEGFGGDGLGLDLALGAALVAAAADRVRGCRRVGVSGELPCPGEQAVRDAGAEAVALDDVVRRVRLVKDPDEHVRIAACMELCAEGQAAVAAACAPGAREIDLFTAAHAAAQRRAGAPVQFVSDMLAGGRSAEVCGPMVVAGAAEARAGDVVIADVAVGHDGYWGDSAWTHMASRTTEPDEVADALTGVTDVLLAAAAALRPGAVAADVYDAVASQLAERFPGGRFPHHAGHGVGLTVFEDPHLVPADRTALEAGMAIAVEPGVYFPGRFGVRREHVYLVAPGGGVPLEAAAPSPLD